MPAVTDRMGSKLVLRHAFGYSLKIVSACDLVSAAQSLCGALLAWVSIPMPIEPEGPL